MDMRYVIWMFYKKKNLSIFKKINIFKSWKNLYIFFYFLYMMKIIKFGKIENEILWYW
jgi:hypothetical protein